MGACAPSYVHRPAEFTLQALHEPLIKQFQYGVLRSWPRGHFPKLKASGLTPRGWLAHREAVRYPSLATYIEVLREDGIEIEPLDERLAAPHADLLEDVLKVFLDGVLGDVEGLRNLPGRGSVHHEPDYLLFPGAQAVGSRVQPRHLFIPGRLDDDHYLTRTAEVLWLAHRRVKC